MFGTLQAAWKQRDALLRPRFGALGLVALPNLLVFQVMFPLVAPVMDLQMVLAGVAALVQQHQHPAEYSADTLTRTLFFYSLFVAVDLGAALLAFLLERKEDRRLLIWLPLQRFAYRQLMYYVVVKSITTAIRGARGGLGKAGAQGHRCALSQLSHSRQHCLEFVRALSPRGSARGAQNPSNLRTAVRTYRVAQSSASTACSVRRAARRRIGTL